MTSALPVLVEPRPIWLKEHEKCDANFTPLMPFTMKNNLGTIRVGMCPGCGYLDVVCLHLNNTINVRKVTITCKLCGA